jgi:acyl-CoA dehydrogenase
MTWGFSTDPAFQEKLDWIDTFVREQVEPLDHICDFSPYDVHDARRNALVRPLQAEVRRQGLWACHLEPELGGAGFGQLKLALMNEILGRSAFGPNVFGVQAPDTGNGETLAKFGTAAQKARFLQPLLDNEIVSSFSMTEPRGGSDPTQFTCSATLDGDEWVISGEKWFSSHAHIASFLITMAVTDPDAPPHSRLSAFIVPTDRPGIEILKNMPHGVSNWPSHAHLRYNEVRIPKDHLLGERGGGFLVAQTRLGGGRIHHAMRTLAQCKKALEMMCERALSRYTQGSRLSEKQLVQEMIADSWIQIEQFRLLLLQTAWKIDQLHDYKAVRRDIAAVKVMMPKVMHDVASRALQIHGSLGLTNDMPFIEQVMDSYLTGLADGPTEIHKLSIAKLTLREHKGTEGVFPTAYIPHQREAALKKYAAILEQELEPELIGS